MSKLPISFEEKQVGRSSYYEIKYRNNDCKEVETKAVPLSSIPDDYLDGSCLKNENDDKVKSKKYYCSEEGILKYLYSDNNCKNYV